MYRAELFAGHGRDESAVQALLAAHREIAVERVVVAERAYERVAALRLRSVDDPGGTTGRKA